ncbi:conjugal transfer protein TraH [Erwinia sp. S43]|uniref:conjugal transfer protein TraH n=1 Tax=Erwinia sp. S43 TaxID=2769339 RepID=UPI001909F3A7|nr:conjugal transfer protein TraH [Erwinia sp. S43]MBK0035507.1 conjugal transfer protein TraH [Erwinia sp. S43]
MSTISVTSAAGSLDTDEENKHFRENLRQVRNELSARVARIQVQQSGLAEYDRSLAETRQQLSSSVSDNILSNYQFGGN